MRLGSRLCATDSIDVATAIATISARSIFIIAHVAAFAVTALGLAAALCRGSCSTSSKTSIAAFLSDTLSLGS